MYATQTPLQTPYGAKPCSHTPNTVQVLSVE